MSDKDELRQARLKTAADFTDAEYAKMSAEFPGFFSSEVYQYVIDLRQQNAALLADLEAIRGKFNKLVAKQGNA